MALGYTSACLKDEWSLFNNVAGLTGVEKPTVAFTCHTQSSFSYFNRIASVFVQPAGPGIAAIGVYRFGDDVYNEQILSAAFANTLGLASLGIRLNYIQYHAEGFGNTRTLTVSLGGIAQLTPELSVGAHIVNINQPEIGRTSNETLPALMVVGIGLRMSDKVFLTTELEKELAYEVNWKNGIEYTIRQKFFPRAGISLYPRAGFLGFGCQTKKFLIDYAFQYNFNLGASHQATARYQFKTKK